MSSVFLISKFSLFNKSSFKNYRIIILKPSAINTNVTNYILLYFLSIICLIVNCFCRDEWTRNKRSVILRVTVTHCRVPEYTLPHLMPNLFWQYFVYRVHPDVLLNAIRTAIAVQGGGRWFFFI